MRIKLTPTYKQHLAYEALKTHSEVFLGGGAGGGKSWLICESRLVNAILYPGYKSFIGREELKRLMTSTYITWCKVCKWHKIPSNLWKLNGQYNYIEFTNGSRIDLLDVKYLPSDPLYERFGSTEYTDGALEECGEINYMAYEVLKTRLGRHMNKEYGINPTLLMTGNPKKNWTYTYIYKPFKEGVLPDNIKFIQSLYKDNPHTADVYERQLSGIKDTATRERLKDGNWEYDDDPTILMSYEKITDLWTNSHVKGGQKYISCDVARKGQDKTKIRVWDGLRCIKKVTLVKALTTDTSKEIRKLQTEYSVVNSNTIVDEDGVGGGVVDQLKCKGFLNGSRPLPENGQDTNYQNLRAQCYFKLADVVNSGSMFLCDEPETEKQETIQELEQIKQIDVDGDGKIKVISRDAIKENIGRSPDEASCLMMRMYFEIGNNFILL